MRKGFFLIFSLLLLLATVQPALAFDCTCFCATVGGAQASSATDSADCPKSCTDAGNDFIVCAASAAQFPGQNALCFKQEACENSGGEWDQTQTPQCVTGQRYCYPGETAPTILSTSIGGTSSVEDYGEFIQVVYQYGINAAVVIAIVFVMIGGLQYVMAAGTGDTSKAKARIRNSVVGLILLLCVYVILYTVNPRLTLLDPPKFPKVRRVEYIDAQSCEYLAALPPYVPPYLDVSPFYGDPYELGSKCNEGPCTDEQEPGQYGEDLCGSIDTVIGGPSGAAVPDGTTCQYELCENANERCVGVGADAKCLKCTDIYTGSVPGLVPAEDICEQATQPFSGGAGDLGYSSCFYTHDPGVIIANWQMASYAAIPLTAGLATPVAAYGTAEAASDVYNGLCAEVSFDCEGISSCRDYDEIQVTSGRTSNQLDDLWYDSTVLSAFASPVNLTTICAADPCKVGRENGYGKTNAGDRCVALEPEVVVFGVTVWDAYGCYTYGQNGTILDGESGWGGVISGWIYN